MGLECETPGPGSVNVVTLRIQSCEKGGGEGSWLWQIHQSHRRICICEHAMCAEVSPPRVCVCVCVCVFVCVCRCVQLCMHAYRLCAHVCMLASGGVGACAILCVCVCVCR